MTTLEINGTRVEVDSSFNTLSPEQQNETVEEIARQLGEIETMGVAGAFNQGSVRTVGGFIDLLNPLDKPHALNPFPEGTGSAVDGINNLQRALGIKVPEGDPEGVLENMAYGAGGAAGMAVPAAKGTELVARYGSGIVADLAKTVAPQLATRGAIGAEMTAGAVTEGAEELALEAGASPETAAMIGLGAGAVGLPAGLWATKNAPVVLGARAAGDWALNKVAPYTRAGGRAAASARVQELAGSPARAQELAERLGPSELMMTPADQLNDPKFRGLENMIGERFPEIRARRDQLEAGAPDAARMIMPAASGNPEDAQRFIAQRYAQYTAGLTKRLQDALRGADANLAAQSPNSTPGSNSVRVEQRLRDSLRAAKVDEQRLWADIPPMVQVPTQQAKERASELAIELGRSRAGNMPDLARKLLLDDAGYGDMETVQELYGLYSEMDGLARRLRGSPGGGGNAAYVASEIADAILRDLGAVDGTTEVGAMINNARDYTAALKETFSTGAVGRILQKDGNAGFRVEPETGLRKTIGTGGDAGGVASRQIQRASPEAAIEIEDYMRGGFTDAVRPPTGGFSNAGGQRFIRNNQQTLGQFPELRSNLQGSLDARQQAQSALQRGQARIQRLEDPRQSVGAAFASETPQNAARAIFSAKSPARAAVQMVRQAAKDTTGKAMEGLKASVVQDVMAQSSNGATLNGKAMLEQMGDPATMQVLNRVMGKPEIARMRRIASELAKVQDTRASNTADLFNKPPNKVIQALARIGAANRGAQLGRGGASLQTAQMASSEMRGLLTRLTNRGANQILRDAVTDPELMRDLLRTATGEKMDAIIRRSLAPYLVGATSAALVE